MLLFMSLTLERQTALVHLTLCICRSTQRARICAMMVPDQSWYQCCNAFTYLFAKAMHSCVKLLKLEHKRQFRPGPRSQSLVPKPS